MRRTLERGRAERAAARDRRRTLAIAVREVFNVPKLSRKPFIFLLPRGRIGRFY
jgi:hypothetical protein